MTAPGITYGEPDDFGYVAAKDMSHVHDLQATILNEMGLDHTNLTYRHNGRGFNLAGVEGQAIREILV